ncbi:MAG: hypothetical protein HC769_04000 [Cyanobacteria bacterium CRU_2_1]|nr:hypothetical protein [Cyanobacteria bacterium CRU_2_1]
MSLYALKLQQYEDRLTELIYQLDGLGGEVREELNRLQQALQLNDEMALFCQQQVIEAYEQKKQKFEQAITNQLHQRDCLTEEDSQRIRRSQPHPHLATVVVAQIEINVAMKYLYKKQQFKQAITGLLHQQDRLGEDDCQWMREWQELPYLNQKVIAEIKQQVIATYQQKKQQIEQIITQFAYQEIFLTDADWQWIQQNQHSIPLNMDIVLRIKRSVLTAYQHKKQEFETILTMLIHKADRISDEECQRIRQLQSPPRLSDTAIEQIKTEVTNTYSRKIQQYEEVCLDCLSKHYLSSNDDRVSVQDFRESLQHCTQTLNIRSDLANLIRDTLCRSYQNSVQAYRNRVIQAVWQQFPLRQETQQQLDQMSASQSLDIQVAHLIQSRIIKTHQANWNQYYDRFIRAVRQRYPLPDAVRESLNQEALSFNLSESNVRAIEQQALAELNSPLSQDHLRKRLKLVVPIVGFGIGVTLAWISGYLTQPVPATNHIAPDFKAPDFKD